MSKPISLSQHGNKERNIGNHLKSIPRVYIKLKNKKTSLVQNYLGLPKLSQVQQNSNLCRTYDHHWLKRFRHVCQYAFCTHCTPVRSTTSFV